MKILSETQDFLRKKVEDIYNFYHDDRKICYICNDPGLVLTYTDENPSNFLLTNLKMLCVPHTISHRNLPQVEVTKRVYFDSAHFLKDYDGKCRNLHGHRWTLDVTIKDKINEESGMVVDFSKINSLVKDWIISSLDHTLINNEEVLKDKPTAENMLLWIWEKLETKALIKGLKRITLYETPDSYASIDPESLLNSEYIWKYYHNILNSGKK